MALLLDVGYDWSAPRWSVREISAQTARRWIAWHYMGTLPNPDPRFCGVFCPDLICIVMVGQPANTSGQMRLGIPGKGNWEVTRVVAHPEAPKNTVSRSLKFVGRYLHQTYGLDWLYSYADTGQGHHGGVYQAVGGVFVGTTGTRTYWEVDGTRVHPRTMVWRHGTQALSALRAIYGARLGLLKGAPKHLYVLPIAGPRANAGIRAALASHTLPYPKRRQPLENEGPACLVGNEDAVMRSGGSTHPKATT